MSTAEIRKHWSRVADLGCCVTGGPIPTIHHCHGGSMLDIGIYRAKGKKPSDWLVIPLAVWLHVMGNEAIDGGKLSVREWEARYGTQVAYLDWVCKRLRVDVWARAGIERVMA